MRVRPPTGKESSKQRISGGVRMRDRNARDTLRCTKAHFIAFGSFISRFLRGLVLTICRFDERKSFDFLVRVFAFVCFFVHLVVHNPHHPLPFYYLSLSHPHSISPGLIQRRCSGGQAPLCNG
jgi:hypothetical protein